MTVVQVTLSPDLETFLEAEISSGQYASVNEIFDEALRAMMNERHQDAENERVLSVDIAAGLRQARQGEFSRRSVGDIAQAVIDGKLSD